MRESMQLLRGAPVKGNPPQSSGRPSWMLISGPALIFLASLCALAIPMAVRSQPVGEYGPHIAYSKAVDSENGNYLVGGHLELYLAPFFGVRGAVDYRSSESFPVGSNGEAVRVKSVPVTVSGRLYLPLGPSASPFLQGGAGWYRVSYDYPNIFLLNPSIHDESITTFGWHVGGGLKLGLSERVSVSGEVQYVFVDPERKLDAGVRDQIRGLDYNSTTFGLGLSVGF